MATSVKLIKFMIILSVFFLCLTYFVTLNIEKHLFETIWFSNNFMLTIFGGIFTGVLVSLMFEIQKYITTKADTKNFLFYQSYYLYHVLFLYKQNILDYLEHPDQGISKSLLDERIRMIQNQIYSLQSTDYTTFFGKSCKKSLMIMHRKFCGETLNKIKLITHNAGNSLKIAITTVEINQLSQNLQNPVTSAHEPVKNFLVSQYDKVSVQLDVVNEHLQLSMNAAKVDTIGRRNVLIFIRII